MHSLLFTYRLGSRRIYRHTRRGNYRAAAWYSCFQALRLGAHINCWSVEN